MVEENVLVLSGDQSYCNFARIWLKNSQYRVITKYPNEFNGLSFELPDLIIQDSTLKGQDLELTEKIVREIISIKGITSMLFISKKNGNNEFELKQKQISLLVVSQGDVNSELEYNFYKKYKENFPGRIFDYRQKINNPLESETFLTRVGDMFR